MVKKNKHQWFAWVPIAVDAIKNEDGVYSFKFRFEEGMDEHIVAHFDPQYAGCGKCQGMLEDVFGEPCSE